MTVWNRGCIACGWLYRDYAADARLSDKACGRIVTTFVDVYRLMNIRSDLAWQLDRWKPQSTRTNSGGWRAIHVWYLLNTNTMRASTGLVLTLLFSAMSPSRSPSLDILIASDLEKIRETYELL